MDIRETIKSILTDKFGVEPTLITDTASFTNDMGLDSLDHVELIMEIEKMYGIYIKDEDAEKCTVFGDAVKYIENRVKELGAKATEG